MLFFLYLVKSKLSMLFIKNLRSISIYISSIYAIKQKYYQSINFDNISGALAEDVFEKRHAQKRLIIRFKISYSNSFNDVYTQVGVFLSITMFLI